MTQQEIIGQIGRLLQQHVGGFRGALTQAGYREDFFRLFVESYWQVKHDASLPPITGDGLREDIAQHWQLDDGNDSQQKRDLIHHVCMMWDDWQFAWDHYQKELD